MICVATLAMLCVAPPDELQELVDVWISELNDDLVERRLAASEGLLSSGPRALRAITEAIEETRIPEIQHRARDLVWRMDPAARVEGFGGGKNVGGFAARITGPAKSIVRGDPIVFHVEIQNVSTTLRPFIPIRQWGYSFPGRFSGSSREHARIVVTQIWGEPVRGGRGSYGSSSHCTGPDRTSVEVRPRQSIMARFEYRNSESLPAGEYEAYVTYHARNKQLIMGAETDLQSNRIRFIVRDRKADAGH